MTWAEDALVSLQRFGSLLEHGRRWSVYVCELGRLWTFDDDGTGGALALVVNPAAVTVEPPCECVSALRWIVDHGDTGTGGRPAFHDMRARARAALELVPACGCGNGWSCEVCR